MRTLEQGIRCALDDLAGGAGGGSDPSADTTGAYPLPWLLLDLEQLLPPGCSLARNLQRDNAQLCRELDAAGTDPQVASHLAARLLAAIAADAGSRRKLAELLCRNDAMLELCLEALQRGGASGHPHLAQAVAADINTAAWQVFGSAAGSLQATQQCIGSASLGHSIQEECQRQLPEGLATSARALEVATRMTCRSATLQQHALQQHGNSIAAVYEIAAAQAPDSLPDSCKAALPQLMRWWAARAPELACDATPRDCRRMLEPALSIAGAALNAGCG